ncbi:hypothetical protein SBV1_1570069 [Verrucomicrobia bacterium]|nr:hypothetical protein SBV1_1570069 [Verrucomicrobiota bacterium]
MGALASRHGNPSKRLLGLGRRAAHHLPALPGSALVREADHRNDDPLLPVSPCPLVVQSATNHPCKVLPFSLL